MPVQVYAWTGVARALMRVGRRRSDHLRKVLTKLGVTARRQLGLGLKDESGD